MQRYIFTLCCDVSVSDKVSEHSYMEALSVLLVSDALLPSVKVKVLSRAF